MLHLYARFYDLTTSNHINCSSALYEYRQKVANTHTACVDKKRGEALIKDPSTPNVVHKCVG